MWTVGKNKANSLGYGSLPQSLDPNSILGRVFGTNIFGTIIIIVLAIFVIAALVSPVANLTTGVTLAHTGFTPNSNITGTPGLVPILQLYPLFFVFIGLIFLAKHFGEDRRGL
jgi:hypothetical protein